jgi:hypothetical protein
MNRMNRIRLEKRQFKDIFDKFDSKEDRYYNRISGSIGWPSADKLGALTVWGEELLHRPVRKPKIFWLAEFESHSVSELVARAVFFTADLCADPIIATRNHADYMQFFNREAHEKRAPEIYFQPPQKPDESLEYYLAVIHDLLNASNKRLYLGESKISSLLQQMQDSVAGLSVKDYPLLASCGFVVSALAMATIQSISYDNSTDRVETEQPLFTNRIRW